MAARTFTPGSARRRRRRRFGSVSCCFSRIRRRCDAAAVVSPRRSGSSGSATARCALTAAASSVALGPPFRCTASSFAASPQWFVRATIAYRRHDVYRRRTSGKFFLTVRRSRKRFSPSVSWRFILFPRRNTSEHCGVSFEYGSTCRFSSQKIRASGGFDDKIP